MDRWNYFYESRLSVPAVGPGAAGRPDDEGTTVHSVVDTQPVEEISVDAENFLEEMKQLERRIHRFPHSLRRIRGKDGCYVVPSMVALGPYHHDAPHLQKMEKVKHHAARTMCQRSVLSVHVDDLYDDDEVLRKVRNIRGLYDESTQDLPDDDAFARMMVLDGCFLLWYLTCLDDPVRVAYAKSCGDTIHKDLYLLENQIPLVVLDSIGSALGISDVHDQIAQNANMQGLNLYNRMVETGNGIRLWGCIPFPCHQTNNSNENESSKQVTGGEDDREEESPPPLHLIDLLRFGLLRGMPPKQRRGKMDVKRLNDMLDSIGTVKLVESGVKVTARTAGCFAQMKFKKKIFFAKLSLSRLNLDHFTACWLINMVALESLNATTLATCTKEKEEDGYVISSYIGILASLMDREEDVRQLRKSGVLASSFSDAQTLAFFKGLRQHLRLGYNYYHTVADINNYLSRRSWRIAVYKFFCNNYKAIAAVLSLVAAFVTILKALYSMKRA